MAGMRFFAVVVVSLLLCARTMVSAAAQGTASAPVADGAVVKQLLLRESADKSSAGASQGNLLKADSWRAFEKGFQREGGAFVCDNAQDGKGLRGVSQNVTLNQTRPEPIIASAWSKAENAGGARDSDYSLYLDLVYTDGTPLWGQSAPFKVGAHDWERVVVKVMPEKSVRSLSFHLLFRRHSGKAWFRDPELRTIAATEGALVFDGVAVALKGRAAEGFQARDAAAESDFVRIEREALGLKLEAKRSAERGATFMDVTLSDTQGKDRAITLIYAIPLEGSGWRWLEHARHSVPAEAPREYMNASRWTAIGGGRLSYYPFAAVANGARGLALGIDMAAPAFFRCGYNAGTKELFLAYDLGLAPEKPSARVRFCSFDFDPAWEFRAALGRYHEIFSAAFQSKTPQQGLWMPFAKISEVKGWEDFGFKFKEGDNETKWDDEHNIITFRYTEPMTWWMKMPKEMPRTLDAALAEARRLADAKNDSAAKAFFTSGYHDAEGKFAARLLDTPWCDGTVWSMNSAPGIKGEKTDFKNKWNPDLIERLYGSKRKADLDGEYVDSSEGYVTDELDFRRDHFAAAETPLTFRADNPRPAIFRGLIAFEYVRGIAKDVHGMGKLMMANGAPDRLCWLAPMLEVMGTETDWNRSGKWSPMRDEALLYRRALCGPKPYCFLMNTQFDKFGNDLVEKYMKRSLAYGMFPGFFSHNASQGHYFTRPELYDRDRPLFKKYLPLCRKVAEAGWQPVTRARSSDARVCVERFGERLLTVFNDSAEQKTARIKLEGLKAASAQGLLSGKSTELNDDHFAVTLGAEDVEVFELR
ncbi:MAG: hypothetical protein NTX50_17580 [Candidatus Sumerlaeota bacterium]|nr:hypothetical protein [Candidatus Sumerlaeota bacterium]